MLTLQCKFDIFVISECRKFQLPTLQGMNVENKLTPKKKEEQRQQYICSKKKTFDFVNTGGCLTELSSA